MKKIIKQVEVYDCGCEGCIHMTEKSAFACKERADAFKANEVNRLKVFKRYIGSREPLTLIAENFGITEYKVRAWSRKSIEEFLDKFLSDTAVERYGSDTTLERAINKYTDFWLKTINARLKVLENK